MKRLIVCSLTVLAAVAGVLYAAPGEAGRPAFSAQVVGLQVTAAVPGDDMMSRPFNQEPGVALAVLVRSTDKTIIAFDGDASRLALLQDDKGTVLKAGDTESTWSIFGFPQVAKDGKSVLFELHGNRLPAAGAARIKAEGTAVLKVGTALETARQENVALKAGAKITAGPVPFTVKDVQPSGAGLTLTLTADQDIEAINEIQFLGPGGAAIETQDAGSMTMRMMGKVTVEKQISFEKKVDAATVVLKYWKGLETVQVPLKLEAGLALQ